MSDIFKTINQRIQKEAIYFFIRKSDGEPILCTPWYWMTRGKRRTKELDWYDSKKPYYSNYSKKDIFLKRHDFVGKL